MLNFYRVAQSFGRFEPSHANCGRGLFVMLMPLISVSVTFFGRFERPVIFSLELRQLLWPRPVCYADASNFCFCNFFGHFERP